MRSAGSGLWPSIAAANGDDPSDDQQYWKYQAPHEPAVHQASLSVVSEPAVALGAPARDRQPAPKLHARRHPTRTRCRMTCCEGGNGSGRRVAVAQLSQDLAIRTVARRPAGSLSSADVELTHQHVVLVLEDVAVEHV